MQEENKYTWTPSLKWLAVSSISIIAVCAALFFLFNFLLKDYMRDIPKQITPWLVKAEPVKAEPAKTEQTSKKTSENKK